MKLEKEAVAGTTAEETTGEQHKDKQSTPIKPKFEGLNNLSKSKLDRHLQDLEENASFPLDSFPDDVRLIINQKVEGCSYHKDYAAGAHLSAAATAIGATYRANFMGYDVTGNLSMTLVGEPGVNKSEPGKDAYKVFEERDNQNWTNYAIALDQYDIDCIRYAKKEISEKPRLPILKKWIVSDVTLEALAQVCANNNRGVCLFVDEKVGYYKNMNRYNNGGDQEAHLSLFNGTSFNIDRATKKSIRVVNPCVSSFGTIQPALLDVFNKDNRGNNGCRDRELFIWPADLKRPVWSRKRIDGQVVAKWNRIISKLIDGLEFDVTDDKQVPNYIPFTNEAEEILIQWQEDSIREDEEIDNSERFGISAKIYIYVLRFALVLQLLRWACGEAIKTEIDAESARRAIKLGNYFKKQALKVAAHLKNSNSLENLSAIKREIYLALPKDFTTAQAKAANEAMTEGRRLPARTLEYWLTDSKYFNRIKTGHYSRKY